jgi:hypothetical protein
MHTLHRQSPEFDPLHLHLLLIYVYSRSDGSKYCFSNPNHPHHL